MFLHVCAKIVVINSILKIIPDKRKRGKAQILYIIYGIYIKRNIMQSYKVDLFVLT